MRIRTSVCLLACCCAALAGCTTPAPNGPNATVKTPSVGKPPAPASAQAALSSEAFTPYAALGISSADGLAPGQSSYALTAPCMSAAGYPDVTLTDDVFLIAFYRNGPGTLAFAQPWGAWGYLGAAVAQQYGFRYPIGAALTTLGLGGTPPVSAPSLPTAEQAAASKCGAIVQDFINATQNGPLAGIVALSIDINADVQHDLAVNHAERAWSACMARNGYSFGPPQNVDGHEMQAMYGNAHQITIGAPVSPAANQAQIAAAVTDASCTQSSDLAGTYFAVQASYEQQLVAANRQALTAAVSQYRAAYSKEVKRLPALLRTAKV